MTLASGLNARFLRYPISQVWRAVVAVMLAVSLIQSTAVGQGDAARPKCDELMPDTSRLFVSVPEPARFKELWRTTELGKLFNDKAMEPFKTSLRSQIDEKLAQTHARLGLKLSDIEGVAAGEIAMSMVQPEGKGRFYVVMMADVKGNEEKVGQVSQKVRQELKQRGGTNKAIKLDQKYDVSQWTFAPNNQNPEERKAFFATYQDWYVASDHEATLLGILQRLDGQGNNVLAKFPAYQAVMQGAGQGNQSVQLSWFVEPFGLAESIREANIDRQRGKNRVKILKEQGFGVIQGIGGVMLLANDNYDFELHSFVYAPQGNLELAARMLNFPTKPPLSTPDWAISNFSGFRAFNWNMIKAFDSVGTLVDAMAGSEKVFQDMLNDIATDQNGLQINIRNQIVKHLGTRVYLATETETDEDSQINPQSEKRIIAFELTNAAAVEKLFKERLHRDPTIRKRTINKHTIWEIQNSQSGQQDEELSFQNLGNGGAGGAAAARKRVFFKNGALTVAFGYLIYSSDVDYLGKLVTQNKDFDRLANDSDYLEIEDALKQLDSTEDPFLMSFVRSESSLWPNYELFRTGQMAQSETLLGQVLNALLAPDDEDVSRRQVIDGSKLPPYSQIRQYMRPSGFKAYTEPNGYRIVGCVLAREKREARAE